ncbi:hypothetical protein LOTGIDRAFT_209107 [Lottia gigantea]|uniref:Di-N-acetylchitobiase n=1 Tax=Lottia gigantea TaxID=225164 RepID=V4C874_LOTGI|nr:hypothetical protein LOTGIDRAFT_209107 [Lottia gigantea]ESO97904.1 hypothetical protein LOTGIDRAFT_209107 [Lottia gigantea]
MSVFLVFIIISCLCLGLGNTACPCSTPELCEPIKNTTRKEVFIFSLSEEKEVWSKYDYNKVTTVVMVGYHNDELMCHAHGKGVRVVMIGDIDKKKLINASERTKWVKNIVYNVSVHHLDGVNIDFEQTIPKNELDLRRALTSLVAETNQKLKEQSKYYQMTVDVAWRQPCVDDRCYDYYALSKVSDFLFIMAYDERSQILGECIAGANSAITNAAIGMKSYLNLNIPEEKLVLGVPWYGYRYQCLQFDPKNNKCSIKKVPFRGVECSDAAGQQVDYKNIAKLVKSKHIKILFDNSTMTPFFNYQDSGNDYQLWFDGPQSLKLKYLLAVKNGLRGVGMWNADSLDSSNTISAQLQRKEMWGALPEYN